MMSLGRVITFAAFLCATCGCNSDPLPVPHGPASAPSDPGFPTTGNDPLPLDDAVMAGDAARVQGLLEGGANPNARWEGRGDRFPLQEAIEYLRFMPFQFNNHRLQ